MVHSIIITRFLILYRVKLSVGSFNNHPKKKTYGWVKVKLHAYLASAVDGGEWAASHPEKRAPGTNSIRGWVGSRDYFAEKAKTSYPLPSRHADWTLLFSFNYFGVPPITSILLEPSFSDTLIRLEFRTLWDATFNSLADRYRRFGVTCFLNI
jgi:hypothetical protein